MGVSPGETEARIRARLELFELQVSAAVVQQATAYFGLLAKWNDHLNMTSLDVGTPSPEAMDKLLVEPFLAARLLPAGVVSGDQEPRLLDLGSGSGSPAVPLAISIPLRRLVMVESKSRKAAFLRDLIRRLPLPDAVVLHRRVEELRPSDLAGPADLVSIRAVKLPTKSWKALADLMKPGGFLVWFRSRRREGKAGTSPFEFESRHDLPGGSELAVLRRGA